MTRRKMAVAYEAEDVTLEQEEEYHGLADRLRNVDLNGFLARVHGGQFRPDGTPVTDHLRAVGAAARMLASNYWTEESAGEGQRRYARRVCELAGLLHESMVYSGLCREEMVSDEHTDTDETVIGVVCALTPDNRLPRQKRLIHWANAVGERGPQAQLVCLADLVHDARMYERLARSREPGCVESIRAYLERVHAVWDSLGAVERHPAAAPTLAWLKKRKNWLGEFARGKVSLAISA